MIRLLHLADLHPNNASTWAGQTVIDPATGLNQSLTDLARALDHAYTVAVVDRGAHAVIIPGDVFDSARPHPNEIRVILRALLLMAATVPVIVIAGNHDMSQSPADATALESLKGLENVYIFERPGTYGLTTAAGPATCCLLPYPTRGRLLADAAHVDLTPEAVTAKVNDGLRAIVRGFSAASAGDGPRILLAHGSVDGAKVGDQPRSLAHDILIPSDEFGAFDYVAMGHIHQPQAVGENAWYSGSLMRNGFGEEHEQKGFLVVDVERGKPPVVEFIENPCARRYITLTRDALHDHEISGGILDAHTVWRFQDTLTPEEYEQVKPSLLACQDSTPFFRTDVAILEADRMRDRGMDAVLSADEAVVRVVSGQVDEAEMPAILEKHRQVVAEVG